MGITVNDQRVSLLLSGQNATLTLSPVRHTIIATSQVINVYATTPKADIITVGVQGPPGIPEEDMVYADRTDFVSDVLQYRGQAEIGSSESAAVWRIRRIRFDAGNGDDIEVTWADGDGNFDNIWDDRATLSYS